MTVAIPIHMKSWLFKVEPFVVLAGPAKTALIPVDKKRYESITSQDTHGTYLDRLSGPWLPSHNTPRRWLHRRWMR